MNTQALSIANCVTKEQLTYYLWLIADAIRYNDAERIDHAVSELEREIQEAYKP